MPIDYFPEQKYLINSRELARRLGDATVIDVRPAEDFAVGHIERSRHLDIYGVSLNDSSDAPLNAFLSMFQALFGSPGVSRDKPVVIYDHETGERAARAVWLLAVLNHPDVKILDGGTQAWITSGTARPTHSSRSSLWAIRASETMWDPGENGEIEMIRASSSRTQATSSLSDLTVRTARSGMTHRGRRSAHPPLSAGVRD